VTHVERLARAEACIKLAERSDAATSIRDALVSLAHSNVVIAEVLSALLYNSSLPIVVQQDGGS